MSAAATVQTAEEVAAEFTCSSRTVKRKAAEHGIGVNFGGRTGWRFNAEDKKALWAAMSAPPRKASTRQPEPARQRKPRKRALR